MTTNVDRKNVMITDLDLSGDDVRTAEVPHRKTHRKRPQAEKTLKTISGNFNRRSRSAECNLEQRSTAEHKDRTKAQNYFHDLLQTKDKQMEKLLQRLAILHKFNEQFAEENRKLRDDVATLDERSVQLRRQIADCERCRQLSQQLTTLDAQKKTLATDVEMMKTLVYRLNVQIESYQDRLRLSKVPNSETAQPQHQSSISPQWQGTRTVLTHTLAPLLQSYDEMVRDKEELIQQYRQEFEHFTGELKRVLEENTRLLQQNEGVKRDVGSWREERTRLLAQVDVCRTKAEVQTRKSDLAKEKLVEVMHCYEQKMQSIVLDMEHLQSAYARCKTELAALKSLSAQPQDAIAHSLQQCKELLEQLKQQHSNEKQTLERKIVELTERSRGNEATVEKLKHDNNNLSRDLTAQGVSLEELRSRTASLQRSTEKVKRSRDRLKARLRIALQWAQKLEEGQTNIQNTWDALKRLETIVKHKESQVRGLHARHLQEIEKMQTKLTQKEETIRSILKGKLGPSAKVL